MAKSTKDILEESKKRNRENKERLRQLRAVKGSIEFKAGNIDALVINDQDKLKIYTEETADKVYRILIEKMHEGALTLNKDGIILYCNISFATMVGLPLQKVIGIHFTGFVRNSSLDYFDGLLKRALANAVIEEISIHSRDDKIVPVLMSVTTFQMGNAVILSIILTDLTVQNQNQEELRSAAKELQNKNIELETVNLELAFQNREKEKRAVELNDLSNVLKAQQQVLRTANEELNERAILIQQQDEELMRVNKDLVRLNQSLEKRVLERTSELENLNKELKHLNLSKDKFLSVISHDLRNPFSALLISAELLHDKAEGNIVENIKPLVQIIHRTSHKIFQQLNELIDWAQTQRQKPVLKLEKVNLANGVEQGLELLKDIAIQKKVVIENKISVDIYVSADNIMLRSILQNLVTNAIKYTPQNGSIIIDAHQSAKMVEICISDSGIGITPEARENFFEKANVTSVPGTENEKGTGVGLLLVKDFIVQHGGSIRAESKPGKGSRIFFTVPQYQD